MFLFDAAILDRDHVRVSIRVAGWSIYLGMRRVAKFFEEIIRMEKDEELIKHQEAPMRWGAHSFCLKLLLVNEWM